MTITTTIKGMVPTLIAGALLGSTITGITTHTMAAEIAPQTAPIVHSTGQLAKAESVDYGWFIVDESYWGPVYGAADLAALDGLEATCPLSPTPEETEILFTTDQGDYYGTAWIGYCLEVYLPGLGMEEAPEVEETNLCTTTEAPTDAIYTCDPEDGWVWQDDLPAAEQVAKEEEVGTCS